jgi:hypothetical protein
MKRDHTKLSRRAILQGVSAAAVVGAGIDGLLIEPGSLSTKLHAISVPRLPKNLQEFTIAHLTDLHLDQLGGLHQQVVEQLRKYAPQLVVLTGDSIDSGERLQVLQAFCAKIKAKGRQTIALSGNWESWGKVEHDALVSAYSKCDVRWMGNESTQIDSSIALCTTDDFTSGNANIDLALRQMRKGDLNLLLTHSPQLLDEASDLEFCFHLCLAGHTHGGQVTVLGMAPVTPPGSGRFVSGFYETQFGRAYVCSGIGTSVVCARFMCRPELAFFRFSA